jgi:hypothetical protein
VAYAASFVEWFAEEGRRAYGEVIPSHNASSRLFALRQPIGVTAAITPWRGRGLTPRSLFSFEVEMLVPETNGT